MKKIIFFIIIIIGIGLNSSAQVISQKYRNVEIKAWEPSPQKAAMLSALCPGLGQVYNKKYWYYKVPVIYGIASWLIYGAIQDNKQYNEFKDAYRAKTNPSLGLVDIYDGNHNKPLLTEESLKNYVDKFKYKREKSILWITLLYAANILEANVTAHLYNYDVSEDLSIRIEPTLIENYNNFTATNIGIKCSLRF